ncbi:hypothetical protein ACKWTF_016033 [Chironomus riparius]
MQINSKYCSYDPVQKIWSGRKCTPIYNTDANLGYLILQKLIQSPQSVFQISDNSGIELTDFDIYMRSIKFANFLIKSGLKQGDVVGLNVSNSENLSSIIFACFTLGIAVNPLAIVMDVNDICSIWLKTKPKIIFCDGKIAKKVKSAVDKMDLDVKIATLIENVAGFQWIDEILEVECDDFEFPDLPNISSTIALILCSSGTTNSPKCICKSHKQIITNYHPFYEPNLKSQDIYFLHTVSHWVSYHWFLITCALYGMKLVITTEKGTPELWMDIIDRQQVIVAVCIPQFGSVLLKSKSLRQLPSLRIIAVGGTPFTEKLIADLVPLFPNGSIRCSCGCTESDQLFIMGREDPKGANSGYPFKNVDVKIIDDAGNTLGPKESGQIYYKTPVPFSCYLDDPESYKQSFDSLGFIASGDIGYFDEQGRIYVKDRIKHMIKTTGPKSGICTLAPIELETIINEINGVIQSCVVGFFDKHLFYDIIYAFVIKDAEEVNLTEEFVMNYVNTKVIDGKRITGGVYFIEKFPLIPSGKVLSRELKKIATEINKNK